MTKTSKTSEELKKAMNWNALRGAIARGHTAIAQAFLKDIVRAERKDEIQRSFWDFMFKKIVSEPEGNED